MVAAAFFLLNPYITVFTARTTITLLGYAALPWLLLITHHGLRTTRGWRGWRPWCVGRRPSRWCSPPRAAASTPPSSVWMLVGPLVLLLYEPAVGDGALARLAAASSSASACSASSPRCGGSCPLLVHVKYGIDFLQFTEQPGTIWGTNSITESLRLMGYWTSYIGVGFGVSRPFFSDGGTLLFNPLVVGASLLLPALAVAGFVRARRLSYAPFLLLLVVVGVVIDDRRLPRRHAAPRGRWSGSTTTSSCCASCAPRTRRRRSSPSGSRACSASASPMRCGGSARWTTSACAAPLWWRRRLAIVALMVLAALPLIRGQAIDTQLSYKRIPAAWTQAGAGP